MAKRKKKTGKKKAHRKNPKRVAAGKRAYKKNKGLQKYTKSRKKTARKGKAKYTRTTKKQHKGKYHRKNPKRVAAGKRAWKKRYKYRRLPKAQAQAARIARRLARNKSAVVVVEAPKANTSYLQRLRALAAARKGHSDYNF